MARCWLGKRLIGSKAKPKSSTISSLLVILPVLVDLWLWFGPRLSIQPVVDALLRLWSEEGLPAELAQTAEPYRQVLEQIIHQHTPAQAAV